MQQNISTTIYDQEQEENQQTIQILKICYRVFMAKWYWFIASALICLALGYLYQQRKMRVYHRQAVMLIENAEAQGGSSIPTSRRSRGNMNTLLELNGISVGDNLSNEMFILSSERLMKRVVDTLGLCLDMNTKQALHNVPLYKEEPILLIPSEAAKTPVFFTISIDEGGKSITMKDFRINNEKLKKTIKAPIGQTVKTPAGTYTVKPGPTFDEFERNKDIEVTYFPTDITAKIYKNGISATDYDKESSLIVLNCQDTSPKRAEDILNEVFKAYKADVVGNKNRVAANTARFIESRLNIIGDELNEVENRLSSFKQQNRIVDIQANGAAYVSENIAARHQAIQLETQLSVARYLRDFLQSNSNANELIPALDIEGAGVGQQISAYNQLMNERNKHAANSSEYAPIVREADTRLAAMRSSILSGVNSYVRQTEIEAAAARNQEALANSQVSSAPIQERLGLDIQRQQALKEALYTYLLNKREEVTLQLAINEANVRMVEEPLGEIAPTSPKTRVILLISLLLGLAIPGVTIWLITLFDVTISHRGDVEAATTIPIAGELPHWDEAKDKTIADCEPDAPIVEAFRLLRYSLNFMKQNAKVFVLTSSTPAHGKSFIARNLSAIFAMANKRVLLIDADIRKRTLSRHIHQQGLTSLLSDEARTLKLKDFIMHDFICKGVDLLPAGILPPNPAELLMSERLDEIIEEAKGLYDYIIVDTTPLLAVADANIVHRVADLTLFIIRIGVQEKAFLPDLEKAYKEDKLHNPCIILNDANSKFQYGNYTYGHGYGYGYGYGYGNYKREKTKEEQKD